MTVEEALEYGRFETWLLDRGPMAIGIPRVHEACPIAVYLRETAGVTAVRVGRDRLSYRGRVVDLPRWAKRFVRAVDRCSAPLDGQQAANLLKQAWEGRPPSLPLPRKGGEDWTRRLVALFRAAAV